MKALVYNGARDVSISEVDDPTIELPGDVIVKLTTTNICGSDLHMYEGRTEMEEGRVLGHVSGWRLASATSSPTTATSAS
jgi:glutathione-independent formaldehyde dehydrogenase